MHGYEEYDKWTTLQSWLFILSLSGGLIGFAMTMMTLVKDVPREWDFGNIEYTPAKSIYSTSRPEETTSEKMIEALPDGVPIEEAQQQKENRHE